MPSAGFELNSKYTDPWVVAIGKFMINFGGVEWLTFLWLETLAKDEILKDVAVDMPLTRRIELIQKLLEQRNIPKKMLNVSKTTWNTAANRPKCGC